MSARALLAGLAALAVLGCAESRGVASYKAADDERYPVRAGASPECADAARRATRNCVPQVSDPLATRQCTLAQWDYQKFCER